MAHIQLISIVEPKSDGDIFRFPHALPVIITELRKTRHTFNVVDTHLHKKSRSELFDYIKQNDAEIFGISAYSETYAFVKKIISWIKETHKQSLVIVGGLVAVSYQELFAHTDLDIVCFSPEGEYVLPELLNAIDDKQKDLSDIKGIVWKDRKNNQVVKNLDRPFMSQKEYLSKDMPAYDYFDSELIEITKNINSIENQPVKGFPLLTQRGCPFLCTFCGHLYGRTMLRKNWTQMFDVMEYLEKRYDARGFFSHDTNLFLTEKDVDEYCDFYEKRKSQFLMVPEMRASFGDYRMFKKLKQHGVPVCTFGIESGSQKMLDLMKKGIKLDKVRQVLWDAMKADMIIYVSFVFGTPGESRETITETRNFIFELNKAWSHQRKRFKEMGLMCTSGFSYTVLLALPTSELYDKAVKEGYIVDTDAYLSQLDEENYSSTYVKYHIRNKGGDLNMSTFSSKKSLRAYMDYSFNLIDLKLDFYKMYTFKKFRLKTIKLIFIVFILNLNYWRIVSSDLLIKKLFGNKISSGVFIYNRGKTNV